MDGVCVDKQTDEHNQKGREEGKGGEREEGKGEKQEIEKGCCYYFYDRTVLKTVP